ncbi:hypothetical protein BH11ARM1_BH11ARM1_17230 [soil metagenome]
MKGIIVLVVLALSVLGFSQGMMKLEPATKADTLRLESMQKAYNKSKARYTKNPKNAAYKKSFIHDATIYGHESMTSPALPARIKYKQALHIYREVLAIDPKNRVAKPESDLIIKIYQQMGREVPKG